MTDFNFGYNDLDDVDAHIGGGRVLPNSGDYNVMISEIALESAKSGNGHNIRVKYTILDGDFEGSEVQEWLAVVNANETSVNIARSKLKALYVVSGKTNASNFTDLQGSVIRVRIFKRENSYTDRNGNLREGFQTEIVMYMNSRGQDANGKEVDAYNGPEVHAARPNKKAQARSNVENKQQASSNPFDDDDIPF